jgi:hypothetical protein
MDGLEAVRRFLLRILDAARTRERDTGDETSTYTAEGLVQSQLHKIGVAMTASRLRAELFYLHDKGLVKFHQVRVAREDYYTWRITAEGVDVLAGERDVPGIARE